ncbi:MAG: 16S rRNA (cytidine(1402)-2'-O)-methyltransferase [Clostridia bacterium]|nr:16S rRNA (cytidine(1402)-2'-O)-methyltransferase [Clostridia bacterium]
MSGCLYVVGTPIGNLGDMSPRAVEMLSSADFIAAEDTRVTLKLLNKFEIHTPLVSYHEHNFLTMGPKIVERLQSGENCALVTDAGMPAISDPGEDLVRLCRENGVEVMSVPGPSALITALAISGMSSRRFCFEGFLSAQKGERRAALSELAAEKRTLIFYESPHRLLATLSDMAAAFGDRPIAVVKELTKLHENVLRTSLVAAVDYFTENQPKGEYVLIVEGAGEIQREALDFDQAVAIAKGYIADGMQPTAAAKRAAAESGLKRANIYKAISQK